MAPMIFQPAPRLRTKFFVQLILGGLLAVLTVLLFTWAIAADDNAAQPFLTGVVVALLSNALWIVPVAILIVPYCASLRYEIHEDEVIVRAGVITRSVKHVPYRTVTNLEVLRGPFDRVFGLGTLKVQTAGMSGQQGAEETLIGLPNVQEVYDLVAVALRQYRGALAADAAGQEPAQLAAGSGASTAITPAMWEELVTALQPQPLQPLPPQEITVTVDYEELKPMLEIILREMRIIRQNIEL